MKKLVTIGLAAATIAGAGLAFTVPASADDWQGRSYSNNDHRGEMDQAARERAAREQALRERQGPRDSRVAHYEYHRNGCSTYWHWSHGQYVRTDKCRR